VTFVCLKSSADKELWVPEYALVSAVERRVEYLRVKPISEHMRPDIEY